MRYLLLSVILLSTCWVAAQQSSTQTSSPMSGQTGSTASGGETTVQGCLSGSNGNYMLTDKNGMSYQLTGDTAKLSQHVGHEIKVTGTTGAGTATGEMGRGSKASQTLTVTSMKHISKTCQNPGGMSH
ncbi:MAG TPA: hypothetical protein VL983_07760 [Terriglobales bacterium]|nr:hypothetical protein [Terriglobales bacterium]